MEIESGNYAIQNPQIGLPAGETLTHEVASNQEAAVFSNPIDWLAVGAIIIGLIMLFIWIRRRK